MAKKLAFLTFGVFHEPVGHARVQGFLDRAPGVYAAADASTGFQGRSIRDYETWKHSWGEIVVPRCYPQLEHTNYAMTLSLWDDLESVAAFAYKGAHAEALTHRTNWFQSLGLPSYVAWWVDTDRVSWQDAADRMDHLHEHGPTAHAFNFRNAFDAKGNECRMDAARVLENAKANAVR
jgi:hypothetical protein